MIKVVTIATLAALVPLAVAGQGTPPPFSFGETVPKDDSTGPMTPERLGRILVALDPSARSNGNVWQLVVAEVTVIVVFDTHADRMRAISAVRPAKGISAEEMTRMMQANFDSALDARYAIANDTLWAAFIHPLGALQKDQLVSGVGQVINLQQSFGTLYSSGALQFNGGDSGALQRKLIDDLLAKTEQEI